MKRSFQFELITPEQIIFRGPVQEVIAPGKEGYFGIEAGHLYFATILKKGILTIKQNSQIKKCGLISGIIQVTSKKVVVCAEQITI